jgi:2-keto-4-pentenoate hydratase/2-oxohepta-3-ene-1,7-dioic acid hydratase in catechol pathway
MQFATILFETHEQAAVVDDRGFIPVEAINSKHNTRFELNLFDLVASNRLEMLLELEYELADSERLPWGVVRVCPPWRRPGKIWGIGLNYREHAQDLKAPLPDAPASFMKPATAVIGPNDPICLPAASQKVTAEAELGLIIGKPARNVSIEHAPDHICGYTPIIDMTALDILEQNPRYLTRAKSFDSFFSFGPVLVAAKSLGPIEALTVKTIINDTIIAQNTVSRMTFSPYELLSFHSQGMTLEPGDIISTGTPGAGLIQAGDRVTCQISGFPALSNPVGSET